MLTKNLEKQSKFVKILNCFEFQNSWYEGARFHLMSIGVKLPHSFHFISINNRVISYLDLILNYTLTPHKKTNTHFSHHYNKKLHITFIKYLMYFVYNI